VYEFLEREGKEFVRTGNLSFRFFLGVTISSWTFCRQQDG